MELARNNTLRSLRIPSLDGIRAISFFVVFLAHAGLDAIIPGGLGVTVFFFLSGYLITTLMRLEREKNGTVSLRQFYIRRMFRILPPFYVVLGVSTLLAGVGILPDRIQVGAVAAQALHVANYWLIIRGSSGIVSGTGVFWSLAVEEHFYLIFPLFFIGLHKLGLSKRGQATVIICMCLAICLWRCVLVLLMNAQADRTYLGSDTRFDSILFGCLLAVVGNPILDTAKASDGLWKHWLLPGGVVVLLGTLAFRAPWFRESVRYSLQGLALYPIFATAIRFHKWWPFRALNSKALSFFGVISYGLYLVHHIVLRATEYFAPAFPSWGKAAISLVVSVAFAYALNRFVEVPFTRIRQHFLRNAS